MNVIEFKIPKHHNPAMKNATKVAMGIVQKPASIKNQSRSLDQGGKPKLFEIKYVLLGLWLKITDQSSQYRVLGRSSDQPQDKV